MYSAIDFSSACLDGHYFGAASSFAIRRNIGRKRVLCQARLGRFGRVLAVNWTPPARKSTQRGALNARHWPRSARFPFFDLGSKLLQTTGREGPTMDEMKKK